MPLFSVELLESVLGETQAALGVTKRALGETERAFEEQTRQGLICSLMSFSRPFSISPSSRIAVSSEGRVAGRI